MKSELSAYRHLAWLFANEVRMLPDRDRIASFYHQP